jgi:hypothetical protein
MQELIVLNPNDFWSRHQELTRQIVREELSNIPQHSNQKELLVLEDVCTILHKSKASIYNYMKSKRLVGYILEGDNTEKVEDVQQLSKKEKESLYFFRSEIYSSFRKRSVK